MKEKPEVMASKRQDSYTFQALNFGEQKILNGAGTL